uniref:Small ribosomal subunit protein mS33 n=1 Tax=Cyclophora tenuis TaxID=216820 RepID=A0A6U1SJF4_CYCTE
MASSSSSSAMKLLLRSDKPRRVIQALRLDIFGELPNLDNSRRSGTKILKQAHTGPYLARYYPDPIANSARKATPGYKTELEERRERKALVMRRRGKGAPKKGAGKRQQRK